MRIAVMGSGGVGGYFGARLAAAGQSVHFLARGAHLEAMSRNGLEVRSSLGDLRLHPVHATGDHARIGPVDIVLFAVKLWDTESAARALDPLLAPDTLVISLQNGVEKDDILRSILPRGHVPGGVCYIASQVASPGVIAHTGRMQKLVFGDGGAPAGSANAFLEACREARIDSEISPSIEKTIWEKFVFLVGLSALTTSVRAPIGIVRSHPETRRLLFGVMEEVVCVGRAKGIPLAQSYAADRLSFCDSLPESMTSSMHNDLERGNRMELAWLSGAVVRLGESLGVPTPLNRVIAGLLAPWAPGRSRVGQ